MFPFVYALLSTLGIQLLYGTGPVLLAVLRKNPITQKQLLVFTILYTFAVWLLCSLPPVRFLGFAPTDEVETVIWWLIFHRAAQHTVEKRGLLLY